MTIIGIDMSKKELMESVLIELEKKYKSISLQTHQMKSVLFL